MNICGNSFANIYDLLRLSPKYLIYCQQKKQLAYLFDIIAFSILDKVIAICFLYNSVFSFYTIL